jgi:hypothetical protein
VPDREYTDEEFARAFPDGSHPGSALVATARRFRRERDEAMRVAKELADFVGGDRTLVLDLDAEQRDALDAALDYPEPSPPPDPPTLTEVYAAQERAAEADRRCDVCDVHGRAAGEFDCPRDFDPEEPGHG